jgi:uncharacterized protein
MQLRTPGVYIQEIPVFPPSVAEVETAIPAFIGYTERATKDGLDLTMKPTKIYSFKQYEEYFGGPDIDDIKVTATETELKGTFRVTAFTPPDLSYFLYYCMKMFYDNGGGPCYVVSVGPYKTSGVVSIGGTAGSTGLRDGLDEVAKEDEPTLIVIPEAVKLAETDYADLVKAVLKQANDLQDRFGVFDVFGGNDEFDDDELKKARSHFGNANLKYGAAYYPFVRTTNHYQLAADEKNVKVKKVGTAGEVELASIKDTETSLYNSVKAALNEHPDSFISLPPSAAVTGLYAYTDNNRGVWKAPAGLSLAGVVEPVVKLTHEKQGEFNIDPLAGVSINALRSFAGKGTLVWGARTLAGNDNEWRYIPVRRFFNMVEESVKKSTYWAVFEPNDANTWVKVRGMIENYLIQKWREGALAGATTKEAFFVRCGLGTTMSAQDILEGKMFVEIGMAVVRPAEFIVLKFFHKLQTS